MNDIKQPLISTKDTYFSQSDWDFIVSTIKNEKCVLFIGPEIFSEENSPNLAKGLAEYLKVSENPNIKKYYKKDDFFLFSSEAAKLKTIYKIRNFFSNSFTETESLFEKLAKIPFHCIVSLTPDDVLNRTLKKNGVETVHSFYHKNVAPKKIEKSFSSNCPLIYNLFGFIGQDESLVLTHTDLFNYFKSIFSLSSMNEQLKYQLQQADNFIFLGLDFSKWYMQILLRLLELHNEQYKFARYALAETIDEEVRLLCINQFKIEFVNHNIPKFVEDLLHQCENKKVVRTISNNKSKKELSIYEQINGNVEKGNIEIAIDSFLDFLKNAIEKISPKEIEKIEELTDYKEDLEALKRRYKRNNRKYGRGVIDYETSNREENQINEQILLVSKGVKKIL